MQHFWFRSFVCLAVTFILAYYRCWDIIIILGLILLLTIVFFSAQVRIVTIQVLAIMLLGILYFQFFYLPPPIEYEEKTEIILRGKVATLPKRYPDRCSFVLRCENQDSYFKNIQIFCNFPGYVQQGEYIQIKATVQPPARPGNPGEFDYPAFLSYQRISYIGSVRHEDDLSVLSPALGPRKWVNDFRRQGEDLIKQVLPAEEAHILLGMLLGNVEGIEAVEYANYQKTGIVHIFSVSGLHVGFLLLITTFLCSQLKLSSRSRFLITLAVLLFYGNLIGWPVPVIRAIIMGSLPLLAYYLGRDHHMMNGLGMAGLFILILNPCSVLQISFQLSFAGTWGLIYIFPLAQKVKLFHHPYAEGPIKNLILIPLCAQLAVIPLLAYHFNMFSPISILSNLLMSYIAGAIVIMGFMAFVLTPVISWLSIGLLWVIGILVGFMRTLNPLLLSFPGSFFWVAAPAMSGIACYYGGLLFACRGMQQYLKNQVFAKPYMIMSLGLGALFFLNILWPPQWKDVNQMEAVFIDVGQGDSTLLKSPAGKFILIDGGGSEFSEVGKRKLLPYLHHRGITELFLIVNTHPDTDHLRGLEELIQEMPVEYAAIPAVLSAAESYENFKRLLYEKDINTLLLHTGQSIQIEPGWNLDVVYAGMPGVSEENYNRASLVLQCGFGLFTVLLTGDAERQELESLIDEAHLRPPLVVKVPHHGSRNSYSDAFYQTLHPQYAVISSGHNNLYGHPHLQVLEGLAEHQIKLFRTDRQGAIRFLSDGRKLQVDVFRH